MLRRLLPASAALWCDAVSILSLTISAPATADIFEWTDANVEAGTLANGDTVVLDGAAVKMISLEARLFIQ